MRNFNLTEIFYLVHYGCMSEVQPALNPERVEIQKQSMKLLRETSAALKQPQFDYENSHLQGNYEKIQQRIKELQRAGEGVFINALTDCLDKVLSGTAYDDQDYQQVLDLTDEEQRRELEHRANHEAGLTTTPFLARRKMMMASLEQLFTDSGFKTPEQWRNAIHIGELAETKATA